MSELDDIRARRAAAEADCGGLTIKPDQYRRTVVDSDGLWVADCYSPEIAVHIAAAPADIDTLLAMVDALTGERDSLRNTLSTACDELRATVAERDALAAQLAQAQRELADAENYAATMYAAGHRYEPDRFLTYGEWRAIYRKHPQA